MQQLKLTLFPSMSKWVKLTVILHCGGARISHMQFLLAGYSSGNEGEEMVPFGSSNRPPQASSLGVSKLNVNLNVLDNWIVYFRIFFHQNATHIQSGIYMRNPQGCYGTRARTHAHQDWHTRHILKQIWS